MRRALFPAAPLFLFATVISFSALPSPCRAEEAAGGGEVGLHDYVLTDPDGKETTLAPYRGKILVVEFFATWCPPCKKELPEITSVQAQFAPDRVAFVAVSADGASKTVRNLPAFLAPMDLKVPVLVGGEIFVDRYAGVEERGGRQILLPQTYVFDGDGEILLRYVGEQKRKKRNLIEELERFLKETPS